MKSHIYSDAFSRIRYCIERNGIGTVLLKPLRVVFAPLIIFLIPKRTLEFLGKQLAYFYHPYNVTWATERCIEVPIGRSYLEDYRDRRVLEIGNVLSHYSPVTHDVLDKFEKGPNVINQDIVAFRSEKKFALILSISTFEHIGFDDESSGSSSQKITEAIETCKELLEADGLLVITAALGYNPEFDALVSEDALGAKRMLFFKRISRTEWRPCSNQEALACQYSRPFSYGNSIVVAEISK